MSSYASLGHGLAKGVIGKSRLGNVRYPVIVLACNGAILFSVSSITISSIKAGRTQQTTAVTYHVIVETAYAEIIFCNQINRDRDSMRDREGSL